MKNSGKKSSLEKENPSSVDTLFRIQYMGYFLAGLDAERTDLNYQDFIRLAKFHLCEKYGILMKDPVWDKYEGEEILTEYYAVLYRENKKAREDFETTLDGFDTEDLDWMEEMVTKNRADVEKKRKELKVLDDEVTFSPEGDKE